jgi:hypothetical protein
MGVSMTFAPLQFSVVRDFGEVTGTELDYTVNLCTATEAVYPYDTVVDDCFDEDRKGWNAINYLDFNEALNNLGSNTIDMNEIGFSLRLDERVIPVDLPNDQAVVTISVDSEVYYHGNNNPVRRRMTYVERISRRSLQNQEGLHTQTSRVSDSFGVTRRSELSWCLLDSGSDDVFRLDVAMDALQFPKRQSVVRDVNALVLSLTQHFTVSLDKVDVLQVDTCDDDNCSPLWTKLNKFDGLRSAIKFVRYYLHIKDFNVAQQLQDQLYNGGAVYQTEWFAPHGETSKKLKDMKIEECYGEFADLKVPAGSNGNSYVPKLDAQEASASGLVVFAAIVSLFALL